MKETDPYGVVARTVSYSKSLPLFAGPFFPIVLLHWGHVENFVMGYQICFALTACGVFGLLAIIANTTEATNRAATVLTGP